MSTIEGRVAKLETEMVVTRMIANDLELKDQAIDAAARKDFAAADAICTIQQTTYC